MPLLYDCSVNIDAAYSDKFGWCYQYITKRKNVSMPMIRVKDFDLSEYGPESSLQSRWDETQVTKKICYNTLEHVKIQHNQHGVGIPYSTKEGKRREQCLTQLMVAVMGDVQSGAVMGEDSAYQHVSNKIRFELQFSTNEPLLSNSFQVHST